MSHDLAVGVSPTLVGVDGSQMGRVEFGNTPLRDGEVGDAGQSDLAVAPWLRAGPLDEVVKSLRLLGRAVRRTSFRVPRPRQVDEDDRVSVLGPIDGVWAFECGVP